MLLSVAFLFCFAGSFSFNTWKQRNKGMKIKTQFVEIFAISCFGIALRATLSLYSYSGAGKPPMYGDYEAQRHWQEITINTPASTWYTNSTTNDLQYWGLDYPPLTAYHSLVMGDVATHINVSYVELVKSRGIESAKHKSFMRLTVLLADILIYVPAMLTLSFAVAKRFNSNMVIPLVLIYMLFPGQILIDNAHFQYNNISLGLAGFAIAAILYDCHYLASLLFSLALNYKQMELYHALPFFAYLLSICCSQPSFRQKLQKLTLIAAIVMTTFTLLWYPWLDSCDSIFTVIKRLFPISRGVFEDKVSNVWCAVNVVYKLRRSFSNEQLALVCLCVTAGTVVPLNIALFHKSNKLHFLYALTNTALGFFLFSFQVHEKTILLVTLPAIALFVIQPYAVFWILEVTTFSMLPLFIKDGLVMPYLLLAFMFHIIIHIIYLQQFSGKCSQIMSMLIIASSATTILLTVCSGLAPTPLAYPHIWPLFISLVSCAQFMLFLVFGVVQQLKPKKSADNKS